MKKQLEGRLQYARLLMGRGMNIDEVLKDSVFSDLNPSTRRSWKKRLSETVATQKKEKVATLEMQNATDATHETTVQRSEETTKTAAETQVEPRFWKKCVANRHPADLVYYTCVAIALHPVVATLQGVGKPVAGIIASVAFVALQGIKSETGIRRFLHLALFGFFEVVFFLLHFSWANNALWANVAGLPFDIWPNKYRDATGEIVHLYGGSDLDKPFYVAIGIAVVMFVSSLYVVAIAIQAAKERAKKQFSNQPETAQNT